MAEEKRGDDGYGAFIQRFELRPPPRSPSQPPLPLQGLTFAVKDMFDISGYVTGFGNPDWARTHDAAVSTSPVVLAAIEAGATCLGKTIMDEMAFSVNGENKHYGTPVNPCAPDRVPGGSSSGSAVAVAAELVNFSLGTDTGGSVRVPAAYCGIFGFRPSHGTVSTSNVIPLAQSLDTVGWFARDPITLSQLGRVFLQLPADATVQPTRIVIPEDCFQSLGSQTDQVSYILSKSVEKLFGRSLISYIDLGDYILQEVPSLSIMHSTNEASSEISYLAALSNASRDLQRFEIKANHGEWITNTKPYLGPGILERVSKVITETNIDVGGCHQIRTELAVALTALLGDHGVLAVPTVSEPPPKLGMETAKLDDFRARAFSFLPIAGMSRFCEASIPLGMHDNLPVSVSLLASHGADHFLLNFAQALYGELKEQASIAWNSAC